MTSMVHSLAEVADVLVSARHRRAEVPPPAPELDLLEGYAVAGLAHERLVLTGQVANGIKIGFTSRAVWPRLGVTGPFWGHSYLGTTREHDDDTGPVDLTRCVAPRLEAEVVLGLHEDLMPGASAAQVSQAVGWAALGFELLDCHFSGWQVTPGQLVADFGGHAGLVLGPRVPMTPQSTGELDAAIVDLRPPDGAALTGQASAVLGGPVSAVVELLSRPDAPTLRAGSLISTGSLTGTSHPVSVPGRWTAAAADSLLPAVSVVLLPRVDPS